MSNKLVPINEDVIRDISAKLVEYLDFKDSIFENEFVESFGDSFKLIKLLKTGHDLISRRKFNAFLKGFCYDGTPTEEQLLKLHKYINNETKAEFIADMFSKVLMSNSKLACMVMGTMINDLSSSDKDITHTQLICANSLTSFFDNDIKNYYKLVTFIINDIDSIFYGQLIGFCESDNSNYHKFCGKNSKNENNINMTLYKAISNQLFFERNEIIPDVQNEDYYFNTVDSEIHFIMTKAGELLYEYIKKISSYLE